MDQSSSKPKTPQAEAMEWALVGGVCFGGLAYFGAISNAPVISSLAYGVAWIAYTIAPGLAGLRLPHPPETVAGVILGAASAVLIGVLSGIYGTADPMERQADRLKRRRERRQRKLNGRSDKFIVR
jgi:hypothetical protein